MEEPIVRLEMTAQQAAAVSLGCEVLVRLGLGQLTYVAELAQYGVIPPYAEAKDPVRMLSGEQSEALRGAMELAKEVLGIPTNGSRGIGHKHNNPQVLQAYEVKKVIDKTLAEHRNPNPALHTVDYDGLLVRYTSDPEPVAKIVKEGA